MHERAWLKRTIAMFFVLAFAVVVTTTSFRTVSAKENTANLFIIAQDGSGDFITIQEGVDNAEDGDTLIVYPGIYTENVEVMGKALNIIGIDQYSCILQCDTAQYQKVPLTIAAGSVKNLTIYGMDTKAEPLQPTQEEIEQINARLVGDSWERQRNYSGYAVHIDQNVLYNRELCFDNCRIISANNHCVGIGTRGESSIIFRGCEIISVGSGSCIYLHDPTSADMVGESRFVMQSCQLTSYLCPYVMTFEALEPANSLYLTFQGVRVSAVAYADNASYRCNNVNTSFDIDTIAELESQNALYCAGFTSSAVGGLVHKSEPIEGSGYMRTLEDALDVGDINRVLSIALPEGITYLGETDSAYTGINQGIKRQVIAIYNYDGLAKSGWCGLNNAYLTADSYGNTLVEMNSLITSELMLSADEQ